MPLYPRRICVACDTGSLGAEGAANVVHCCAALCPVQQRLGQRPERACQRRVSTP